MVGKLAMTATIVGAGASLYSVAAVLTPSVGSATVAFMMMMVSAYSIPRGLHVVERLARPVEATHGGPGRSGRLVPAHPSPGRRPHHTRTLTFERRPIHSSQAMSSPVDSPDEDMETRSNRRRPV
jgi:hypothetical protein